MAGNPSRHGTQSPVKYNPSVYAATLVTSHCGRLKHENSRCAQVKASNVRVVILRNKSVTSTQLRFRNTYRRDSPSDSSI
ncbi:hypothetical protein NPIL_469881 [Nephila pilipes]|uniref:Uncharacterized protein n=1 Tax=Nephila pilipes TaxID=299642 RepID=A0A8X6TI56_NEPPI|nr:hypothetical protein NPIL_469881 [Nephila pilipes]